MGDGRTLIMLQGGKMEVKDAVAAAKKDVGELFAEEDKSNFGAEEVEFDEQAGERHVTLGFSRPWDSVKRWAASFHCIPPATKSR